MRHIRKLAVLGCALVLACAQAVPTADDAATTAEDPEPKPEGDRQVIVISDLHMGLGRVQVDAGNRWHKKEDFRWPKAFAAFLAHIQKESPAGVDLVIAGDFLELWQPPSEDYCHGPGKDAVPVDPESTEESALLKPGNYGCTVGEMEKIAVAVITAHEEELAQLGRFARDGNCVYVVAGNHDASLVLPSVWNLLEKEMLRDEGEAAAEQPKEAACLEFRKTLWSSEDGSVGVEHGHLIGKDANGYSNWPHITRRFRRPDGTEDIYLEQPWGEGFVQAVFNEEEDRYPLIDNLSPKIAGLMPRFRDRGTRSVKDIAKLVRFNLIGTSFWQIRQILGPEDSPEEWTRNELEAGRELGHRLFAGAMPADDPLRTPLLEAAPETEELRWELDAQVAALSDEEVAVLCDLNVVAESPDGCRDRTAGAALEKLLHTRKRILTPHVRARRKADRRLKAFAYGHTHKFEVGWDAETREGKKIRVVNSGAFQRLIDGSQLEARAEGVEGGKAALLASETWEEFVEPCYTFVRVTRTQNGPKARLRAWLMDETDVTGSEDTPCNPTCPRVGTGCKEE